MSIAPYLRVELGRANVEDPDDLPWPVLAEYIQGIYESNMDKEGVDKFRALLFGDERSDELVDRLKARGEREGWNQFKLDMEIELAEVGENPVARKNIRIKYKTLAAKAGGSRRSQRVAPKPAESVPVKRKTGIDVSVDAKGRRVYES